MRGTAQDEREPDLASAIEQGLRFAFAKAAQPSVPGVAPRSWLERDLIGVGVAANAYPPQKQPFTGAMLLGDTVRFLTRLFPHLHRLSP